MVLSIGRRAGLDDADLDELVQAVRLRVWRAKGDADDTRVDEINTSYVHTAARSAVIDILRSRRSHLVRDAEPIESLPLADTSDAPDRALESRETTDGIMMAVDALPPDRRAAVKLHLAGYRREEIASMLGWSVVRTRNLIHRGIADLRERLTEQGLAPTGDR